MLCRGLSVFFASFMMALPAASAADTESREREAKRACLNGEVEVGMKLLTDLYVDTNEPTYIFNQARCFEQNSRYEDAIRRFREYLRKARRATAEDRADVEKHIADCQSLMQKEREKPDQASRPAAATSSPPAGEAPPSAGEVTRVGGQERNDRRGSALRIGGIVTGSAGGAALIVGILLNLKYNSMTSDLRSDYYTDRDSSSHSYKRWSQISYGASAALVVGGALMYYLGWRAGRVGIAPTATTGSPGLALSGGF
jgi:hypothetical protein